MSSLARALLLALGAALASCNHDETTTGCRYDGASYAVGDDFPDVDGCNRCRCEADGTIACTARACIDAGVTAASDAATGSDAMVDGATAD
jgi:hypothetical protein